jgi:hypothetical protein
MKKQLQWAIASLVFALTVAVVGCGPSKGELTPTTDPDAIKKEQDRLRGGLPGGKNKEKYDPIKAEQERLRGGLPSSK